MPLQQGHQLGKVFAQHAWKVATAFSIGVVAVVGGGLFLSDVHRIPQVVRSTQGSVAAALTKSDGAAGTSSGRNGAVNTPTSSVFPDEIRASNPADAGVIREKSRRSRGKKTSSGISSTEVSREAKLSAPSIAPGPDVAQLMAREPAQLASVLTATLPTLAANSPITIHLTQEVSTKENHKGDVFKATLAAPLVANGIVVAKAGASVLGRVVDARSAMLFRGGSNLNLELTDVQTDSGRHLKLKTRQWYETGSHSRLAKAAIVPGEAAKKAVSGVVSAAKSDGEGSDSSERTVTAKTDDPGERNEKKKSSVVVPAGSEIVFRLLEPIAVTGNLEGRP
jgi:hypothetical protein